MRNVDPARSSDQRPSRLLQRVGADDVASAGRVERDDVTAIYRLRAGALRAGDVVHGRERSCEPVPARH